MKSVSVRKTMYQRYMYKLTSLVDSSSHYHLFANALSLSTTQSIGINDSFSKDPIQPDFNSPIKSYVHVYRGGFCGRGNTIASYNELNRYVSMWVVLLDVYSYDIIGHKARCKYHASTCNSRNCASNSSRK